MDRKQFETLAQAVETEMLSGMSPTTAVDVYEPLFHDYGRSMTDMTAAKVLAALAALSCPVDCPRDLPLLVVNVLRVAYHLGRQSVAWEAEEAAAFTDALCTGNLPKPEED